MCSSEYKADFFMFWMCQNYVFTYIFINATKCLNKNINFSCDFLEYVV